MKAKRDNCRRVKTEWRINIYRERERTWEGGREQREANANPLIKATTASLEPMPDINT